jgi:hypothetical protein
MIRCKVYPNRSYALGGFAPTAGAPPGCDDDVLPARNFTLSQSRISSSAERFTGLITEPVIEAAAGRPSGRRLLSHPGLWGNQPPSMDWIKSHFAEVNR